MLRLSKGDFGDDCAGAELQSCRGTEVHMCTLCAEVQVQRCRGAEVQSCKGAASEVQRCRYEGADELKRCRRGAEDKVG